MVIDTSSPKKASKHFKAWVENLKKETQTLHSSHDLVVYTDGAYHHADNRASYAVCTIWNYSWDDYTDWCPSASSFDSELRAIEKAIEVITSSKAQRAYLFCDNKATANAIFNFGVKSSQMSVIRINHLLIDWLAATSLLDFVPPPALSGHAHTQYSECPLVVVVHLLGPLLGPKTLILRNTFFRRF